MGKQHIIELNGQRYDALTGAVITSTPTHTTNKPTHKKPAPHNMDGFSRAPKPVLAHHQRQKSKTLMRTVVSKPKPVVQDRTQHATSQPATKHQVPKHVPDIKKSPLVSRFGSTVPASSHAPSVVPPSVVATQSHSPVPSKTDNPVHRALAHATSHDQPKLKKPRLSKRIARKLKVSPKLVNGVSFGIAFVLIGGFFVYQNIPGLTMRLAASRSGVQGSLPGYQPAGFSLNGKIAYQPGQITLSYKSNSDDRNFRVSQDNSQWDSQSLLDNYVAVDRRDYQTVQDKGKTIYIYDDSNATWVDGGIWYRVEGDSNLSSDQLLNIAASL